MAFDRGLSSAWKKSTKSLNGNCVEVALRDGRVLIRDSKNRDGGHIAVSSVDWQKFTASIKLH